MVNVEPTKLATQQNTRIAIRKDGLHKNHPCAQSLAQSSNNHCLPACVSNSRVRNIICNARPAHEEHSGNTAVKYTSSQEKAPEAPNWTPKRHTPTRERTGSNAQTNGIQHASGSMHWRSSGARAWARPSRGTVEEAGLWPWAGRCGTSTGATPAGAGRCGTFTGVTPAEARPTLRAREKWSRPITP